MGAGHSHTHDHAAGASERGLWSDLLGSIAVIAGALVIHFTGWRQVDPILAVLIGQPAVRFQGLVAIACREQGTQADGKARGRPAHPA